MYKMKYDIRVIITQLYVVVYQFRNNVYNQILNCVLNSKMDVMQFFYTVLLRTKTMLLAFTQTQAEIAAI